MANEMFWASPKPPKATTCEIFTQIKKKRLSNYQWYSYPSSNELNSSYNQNKFILADNTSIWVFVVRSIYFFWKQCLVYWRATSTWAFLQGFLNSLGLDAFCIRGFSLASMWYMISSRYFSVAFAFFSWCSKSDMVDVCCVGERAHWILGEKRWT